MQHFENTFCETNTTKLSEARKREIMDRIKNERENRQHT